MRINHGVTAAFGAVFGISALVLFAQKGQEPQSSTLFPLSPKRSWTMEQTIYLDGKLQSEKRDIIFRVVAVRHTGSDSSAMDVETSVSGVFTERETFLETAPGPPIFLYSVKTPNPETSITFEPKVKVLKNALKGDETWVWKGLEVTGKKKKRKATRKFRAYGIEKVTTPAGVYNALSVEETRNPGIVTRTWYAPSVGIVKRTIIGGNTKTVFLLSVPGR